MSVTCKMAASFWPTHALNNVASFSGCSGWKEGSFEGSREAYLLLLGERLLERIFGKPTLALPLRKLLATLFVPFTRRCSCCSWLCPGCFGFYKSFRHRHPSSLNNNRKRRRRRRRWRQLESKEARKTGSHSPQAHSPLCRRHSKHIHQRRIYMRGERLKVFFCIQPRLTGCSLIVRFCFGFQLVFGPCILLCAPRVMKIIAAKRILADFWDTSAGAQLPASKLPAPIKSSMFQACNLAEGIFGLRVSKYKIKHKAKELFQLQFFSIKFQVANLHTLCLY